MRKLVSLAIGAVAVATLLAGCGGPLVPEPPEPTDSYVFGHFDMDDAPTNLHWVDLQQFAPPTDAPYWSMWIRQGTFVNWYVDPGSYAVTGFGGTSGRTRYTFNVPRQMKELRLVIDKPGIYYLGSWKFKDIDTGFFEAGKFDLVPAESPTQRELVEKLIKLTKDTPVQAKLQAYLETLK